jgi:hypothetical protein
MHTNEEWWRTFHVTGRGLEDRQPAGPLLVDGFTPPAPAPVLTWYAAALARVRGGAREKLRERVQQAATRAAELLAAAPRTSAGSALEQTLGLGASSLINISALAQALQRPAASVRELSADRRARVESAAQTLEAWLAASRDWPSFVVITPASRDVPPGAQLRPEANPFHAAHEQVKAAREAANQLHRALKVVQLESEALYDATQHDGVLSRLSAHPEEWAAWPAILVWADAMGVESHLKCFSRLLRSGHPVHVWIESDALASLDTADFDAGWFAAGHAGVEWWQFPSPGEADLSALASAPVAVAVNGAACRASSRGAQVQADDPVGTAAHLAIATGRAKEHLRLLPPGDAHAEWIPLHGYLAQYENAPPLAIPYVEARDALGQPQRVALTRALARRCHDQQVSAARWRTWSRPPAPPPAPVVVAAPPPPSVDAAKLKREGAAEAVHRLVIALVGATEKR